MQEGRNVCLIIIMKSKELPPGGNHRSSRLARELRKVSKLLEFGKRVLDVFESRDKILRTSDYMRY